LFDPKDPRYGHERVVELGFRTTQSEIVFLIMSSRGAALPHIIGGIVSERFRLGSTASPLSCYLSGGNGMNLSRATFDSDGITLEPIYQINMEDSDASNVIDAYRSLQINDPDPESRKVFHDFLFNRDWKGLVSKGALERAREYGDTVFIEGAKVSVIFPAEAGERKRYLEQFRYSLEPQGYNVVCNDEPFVHVSKKMHSEDGKPLDGKLKAARRALDMLRINERNAGFFGDNPDGNDKGILSFPYSFTNCTRFHKPSLSQPPFVLKSSGSPVGTVYEAVRFLVS